MQEIIPHLRATCLHHHIIFELMTLVVLDKQFKITKIKLWKLQKLCHMLYFFHLVAKNMNNSLLLFMPEALL
jgi:hypothetical protein